MSIDLGGKMSKFKISFVGGGNMAEAILSKALECGVMKKSDVSVFDISQPRLDYLSKKYGVSVTTQGKQALESADIVFLAVKPQYFLNAVSGTENMYADKAVVSIMAGITIDTLKRTLHKTARILRVMPNTPAMVGEGASMLCSENDLTDDEIAYVEQVLGAMGIYETLSEKMMDAFIGVAGSSPAYVYVFIEAMADAAVLNGMPRDIAYKLAAQSVLGAAKMVLETGIHPGQLKDMVSSPGGTTVEALASLENDGFRGTVINAVNACVEKSKYLSRKKDEEN